jgi:transcription elongation GreA/GreB family factor
MDTYSPELAKLLRDARAMQPGGGSAERDEAKREQEAALEELAERISAARSIV